MIALFKNRFVVLAMLALVLLAFVNGGLAAFKPGSIVVDAETEYDAHGAVGHIKLAGKAGQNGERFVTSGDPGHTSETIVAQGSARALPGITLGFNLCKYQYRVFVNDVEQKQYASEEFTSVLSKGNLNRAPQPLEAYTFSLITDAPPLSGKVRVDLYGYLGTGINRGLGGCDTWARIAQDGAELRDGSGTVVLTKGQSDIFEEGQKATFDIATGEGHWLLQMYNGVGEPQCGNFGGGFTPLRANEKASKCLSTLVWDGKKSARAKFEIPSGAFRPDGQNRWRIELRNTLIVQSSDEIITIDQKVKMPEPPKVLVSTNAPKVGDTVIVTLSARSNPLTSSPVDRFEVNAWYGSSDTLPARVNDVNWIARSIPIKATLSSGTFSAQYSFTKQVASDIQIRGYSVDASGRISGSSLNNEDRQKLIDAGLDNANDDGRETIHTPGETPAGIKTPQTSVDSSVGLLALLAAVLLGVVAWRFLPLAPIAKSGVIAGIIGVALVFILPSWGLF